jgi:hypothetical protein
MYCNQCGAPIGADQAICPSCGKSVIEGRVAYAARNRVAAHLHLLSVLWFVVGFLWAIPAAVMFVLAAGASAYLRHEHAAVFAPLLFSTLGLGFVVATIVSFLAGYGLLKVRPWGRTLALVAGFIALLHPPFGTALGIYTLFVLLPEPAGDQYRRMSETASGYAPAAHRVA